MGLREDMEVLARHIEQGDAEEYLRGAAVPLPPEPMPADRSAAGHYHTTYAFVKSRED